MEFGESGMNAAERNAPEPEVEPIVPQGKGAISRAHPAKGYILLLQGGAGTARRCAAALYGGGRGGGGHNSPRGQRQPRRSYGGNAQTEPEVHRAKPKGVNYPPRLTESDRRGLVADTSGGAATCGDIALVVCLHPSSPTHTC